MEQGLRKCSAMWEQQGVSVMLRARCVHDVPSSWHVVPEKGGGRSV